MERSKSPKKSKSKSSSRWIVFISGAAAATIAARVILNFELTASTFLQLLFSALVAGLTVGGKACGKSFAIGCSNRIVHTVARVICFFRTLPRRLGRLFGRHKKS